ncbi:hypothetical protein MMC07_008356 [Pseudocyphellaria aurata]|nr:hypothetical protein [Pseudocyphellaria aurata]
MTTPIPPPQGPSDPGYEPPSAAANPHRSTLSSRQSSPFESTVSTDPYSPPFLRRSGPDANSHAADPTRNWPSDSGPDPELDGEEDMPGRPALHRPEEGNSQVPLLKDERGRVSYDFPSGNSRPALVVRRSTFRSDGPDLESASTTRKKYIYAALFLGVSLVAFTVQTETAVYIQRDLGWNKAYCMLYLTHGSWSLLWPVMLLILRIKNWNKPWRAFWRRHVYILRSTAQMVESRNLYLTTRDAQKSPIAYMLRTTAIVTTVLTIAGGSWYVAVDMTSASDLTAIYNCSAFFAYAFSIPLLKEKIRAGKVFSVMVAVAGVLIVAYGDSGPKKQDSTSGGAISAGPTNTEKIQTNYRLAGNIIIGVGSVLYGFYEVLYKRVACPPEGTSTGRGIVFANTFGSFIGSFTLLVLWIPLVIFHVTGIETFEIPRGRAAWMLLISVLANATFSGSFLVLISLTSPVLSSVAALLTIFIVAVVDGLLQGEPLSPAAIVGGLFIIGAFLLLSWSTYQEIQEERQKRLETGVEESDAEDP